MNITHHIPEEMLIAYAAGSLGGAFSLVVAAHVSMCDECRAALEAHSTVGGALLENEAVVALSEGIKSDLLSRLDDPVEDEPIFVRRGPYPGPVVAALKRGEPNWRALGRGAKQDILRADDEGSVRLLSIPAGQSMPDHSHRGLEMTLVLQGSFSDETGRFGVGDVEVADEELHHTPVADPGEACICLAATDAPLKFKSLVPRLLQPVFRI